MKAEAPKKKRKWLRRAVWFLGILVLLLALAPMIAGTSFGRGRVERLVSEKLGTAVTLGGLSAGWTSDLEIRDLSISDSGSESGKLLTVGRARLGTGIFGLLMGSGPLTLSVNEPELHVRTLSDGRLNVQAFVDGLPPSEPSEPAELSKRPFDFQIEGGKLILHGADVDTYGLTAKVASDSMADQPWSFQWALDHTASKGTVRGQGVMPPPGSAPAEVPTAEITVQGLALEPLEKVLAPMGGLIPRGRIVNLVGAIAPSGDSHRISLTATAEGLSVTRVGDAPGRSIQSVEIRTAGRVGSADVADLELSLTLPAEGASLALNQPGRASWSDDRIEADLDLSLEARDLALIQQSLGGLLPEGMKLMGKASGQASVKGIYERSAASWVERLSQMVASGTLRAEGFDFRGVEVRAVSAEARLSEGRVVVPQGEAALGGGKLSISGELPLADAAGPSTLRWQANPPVVFSTDLESTGPIRVSFTGSGEVLTDPNGVRLTGQITIPEFTAPRMPGLPLKLANATLGFEAAGEPGFTKWTVSRFAFAESTVKLSLSKGAYDQTSGAFSGDVSASLTPAFVQSLTLPVNLLGELSAQGSVRGLTSDAWGTAAFDMSLLCKGAEVQGQRFTDFTAQVAKSEDILTIKDLSGALNGGRVSGEGRVHATGFLDGDRLGVRFENIPFDQAFGDAPAGSPQPYRMKGSASGTLDVQSEARVMVVAADLKGQGFQLDQDGQKVADMPTVAILGTATREVNGTLGVQALTVRGDGVNVEVVQARIPADRLAPAYVDAKATMDGPWLGALLADRLPAGTRVIDPVQLAVKLEGPLDRLMEEAKGDLDLRVGTARLMDRDLKSMVVSGAVSTGRFSIKEVRAQLGAGQMAAWGAVGLTPASRRPNDALTVEAAGFPVQWSETVLDGNGGAAGQLVTAGLFQGKVELKGAGGDRMDLNGSGTLSSWTRTLTPARGNPATTSIPTLRWEAVGNFASASDMALSRFAVTGDGLTTEIKDFRKSPTGVTIQALSANVAAAVVDTLLLGTAPADFRVTGPLAVSVQGLTGSLRADGSTDLSSLQGSGSATLGGFRLSETPGKDVRVGFVLGNQRCQLREGSLGLSDGTVSFDPQTYIGLGDAQRPFLVKGQARKVQIREGLRTPLAVLNPLMLVTPGAKDTSVTGTVDFDIDVRGMWTPTSGWSKSVAGQGFVRVTDAHIKGSAVLLQLAGQGEQILGRPVKILEEVLGEKGVIGRVLQPLAGDGFRFDLFETPLQITDGRINLANKIPVQLPGLTLLMSGWGNLEGEVAYDIGTDLVDRLTARATEKLKGQGGAIGAILGAVNPLKDVLGVQLGATVRGSASRGTDVQVRLVK